ncbi:hypothetical protein INT45_001656 [Circinella minor]|uniref:Magnesium transporter n=1 Tax=Circinella minor TaxID=1195481 RepID=A0A8H7S4T5_9FUNG|nr:hypothetical protein INT45_001656 [Circinella minor]
MLTNEPKDLWGPLSIALLASMTQAFGISLQRRSHLVEQRHVGINDNLPLYKRPLWLSGFLIYTMSNIVQSTCTIGYLPIVILAPIGAIGLVFNAIFAKIVLGDPFTLKTITGTMLIVIGAMLVAGFGVVPEPNHSLQDLIRLYKRPSFVVYFAIIESFTCLGLITTHFIQYKSERSEASGRRLGGIYTRPDLKMWLGISYGVFGANISSQAMLFAKSGLELLILSVFHHDNQFIYPLTWVLVLALCFTAILQLYYLNRGIRLCDTIILVPLNFCSFNVSCLFNGLVYYDQWERLFWWQMVAVLLGIAILIGGVLVISWQPGYMMPASEPEQESTLNTQKQPKVVSKNNSLWAKLRSYRQQDTINNNQPDERTRLLQ